VTDAPPAKVTVIIVTYNHERFIRQAIDSVLMQQADFPYDVIILEDCSTDRTREIVLAYQQAHPANIRVVLSRTNQCNNAELMKAIQASTSPFVALLDGDDYWTSTTKLRRQVEYLEQHPECALCFHNVYLVHDDEAREPEPANSPGQKEISTLEDLLEGNFVSTCSGLLRRSWLGDIPAGYVDDPCADWSLFVLAAQHGHIAYLNDIMAVYRQHQGAYWTTQGRISRLERIVQFYERLPTRLPVRYTPRIRTLLARRYYELAFEHQRAGQHEAASRRLGECLALEPDVRKLLWSLRVVEGGAAALEFPSEDPDAVRVAVRKAAAVSHDIQLNLPHLAVRADHDYSIEFRARADRPRSVYVGFAQADEPWANLGFYKSVALTEEWQHFVEHFIARIDDMNGRIHFDAGESAISFEVGSTRLRSLPDGVMVEPGSVTMGSHR
jgi:glycosyltransferase involved in cell wall biosynthesis